eukprot:s4841_g4.t1
MQQSRQLYDIMSWRRGKTFNLRVLLTVANWNPPELASLLLPASRIYSLEDEARQDPGADSPGGTERDHPSLADAPLAVTAQGNADGVVVSTPSSGFALDSAEAEKRAGANMLSPAPLPERSEYTKRPFGLRSCPGKRGRRWRHPDGAPMSLLQEHKALVQHCQQLFAPEVAKPTRQGEELTMPVTGTDWTLQLRRTPIGKAVPADSAPQAYTTRRGADYAGHWNGLDLAAQTHANWKGRASGLRSGHGVEGMLGGFSTGARQRLG